MALPLKMAKNALKLTNSPWHVWPQCKTVTTAEKNHYLRHTCAPPLYIAIKQSQIFTDPTTSLHWTVLHHLYQEGQKINLHLQPADEIS